MTTPRRAAVLGGNRTPFARQFGAYAEAANQDMLTAAIEGLVARHGLAGERLGEVVAGAVIKHSRDFNLTREAVLGSSLSPTTPAYDITQACGTGLEAAILVANKIALGQIESGIAGGADSASDAPVVVTESLRRKLLRLNRAKTSADRVKAALAFRPTDVGVSVPANTEPRTGLSMGDHMALTAAQWGVTREDQDELALASHVNLAAAYERGFFDDLLTPYLGLTVDQNLRPGSTLEKLGSLKPVFGKGEGATMTAGNSTPLTDGASAVLLGSQEWADAHGLKPLAWFVDGETAAVDYVGGDEGLLMAPSYAVSTCFQGLQTGSRDFLVLSRRLGLDGDVATLQEVGDELGVTRERVRQLEERARLKCRASRNRDAVEVRLRQILVLARSRRLSHDLGAPNNDVR